MDGLTMKSDRDKERYVKNSRRDKQTHRRIGKTQIESHKRGEGQETKKESTLIWKDDAEIYHKVFLFQKLFRQCVYIFFYAEV